MVAADVTRGHAKPAHVQEDQAPSGIRAFKPRRCIRFVEQRGLPVALCDGPADGGTHKRDRLDRVYSQAATRSRWDGRVRERRRTIPNGPPYRCV